MLETSNWLSANKIYAIENRQSTLAQMSNNRSMKVSEALELHNRNLAENNFGGVSVQNLEQSNGRSDGIHAHFVTRFSIFDADSLSFRVMREEKKSEEKRQKVFDKKRLATKFVYFERLTLPSILNQTNSDWSWTIFYGADLPIEFADRLKHLCEQSSKITCVPVKTFAEFHERVDSNLQSFKKKGMRFASIRIDDDDALVETYVDLLQSCKYEGVASFPVGKRVTYRSEKDDFVIGSKIIWKNIALGLAAFGFNIYKAGDHTLVHQKHPTQYIDNTFVYLLGCDEVGDTSRNFM